MALSRVGPLLFTDGNGSISAAVADVQGDDCGADCGAVTMSKVDEDPPRCLCSRKADRSAATES